MYLKIMKFIHILIGAVLLFGYILCPHLYTSDAVEPISWADVYVKSMYLMILLGATGNLLLGCYVTIKYGFKRYLQTMASLLILINGFFCLLLLGKLSLPIPQVYVILFLVTGLVIHLIINLYALKPGSRIVIDSSEREMGTVKWFNNSKGFGFITRDKGSDIFVHYRAIRGEGHRSLVEGQRVEFLIAKKDKGLQAEDVIAASGNY